MFSQNRDSALRRLINFFPHITDSFRLDLTFIVSKRLRITIESAPNHIEYTSSCSILEAITLESSNLSTIQLVVSVLSLVFLRDEVPRERTIGTPFAYANMFIKSTQCDRDGPRPFISYYYFNSCKFMESYSFYQIMQRRFSDVHSLFRYFLMAIVWRNFLKFLGIIKTRSYMVGLTVTTQ